MRYVWRERKMVSSESVRPNFTLKHDKTLQKGKTNFLNNFSITIIVSYIDGYTSMCIYGL